MKDQKKATKLALFRYGVISPYITNPDNGYKTADAFFKAAAGKTYQNPDGINVQFDVSTIRRWYEAYKENGFEGLLPRRRNDKGKPRKLDADLTERIKYIKKEYPRIPATVVYQKLLDEGAIKPSDVSLSSVTRYIHQIIEDEQITSNKDMKRYIQEHINTVWAGDTCYGPYITTEDNKKHRVYLIGLMDNASRMIVGMGVFFNDNTENLMTVMKSAVSKYGRPLKFVFDNGKNYRNQQISLLAARIGTTIHYCAPYSPEQKGYLERMWRTLREHWMSTLNMNDYHSLKDIEISLQRYVNEYNHSIHSALNGMTPDQRFFSECEKIIRLSDKEIEDAFLFEVERRVSSDNVIVINNKEYEVPYRYSKMRLRLRYSMDMERVYVVESDDKLTPIKLLDKIANAKIKRDNVRLSDTKGANI